MYKSEKLDIEIRMLGRILGDVIKEQAGLELYVLEEEIRLGARARRLGDRQAGVKLLKRIAAMTDNEARIVARAFTIFFDLANLSEDRQRVRVLRERERFQAPKARSESIEEVVILLKDAGFTAGQMQELLDGLHIECVFTAHPTEAKRRSVRAKVRRLREYLSALDREGLLPREQERLLMQIRTSMTSLWQTDLLRPRRPTVLEEVEVGLFFTSTLWSVVPSLYRDLHRALERAYPGQPVRIRPFLRLGSWIGGDRDGNPLVNARVTAETFVRLRRAAVEAHIAQCAHVYETLSPSTHLVPVSPELTRRVDEALRTYPGALPLVEPESPREVYRRFLRVIEWRLRETLRTVDPAELLSEASKRTDGYRDASELRDDLDVMAGSLLDHAGKRIYDDDLQDWISQAASFGLHMTELDIRQESTWNARVVAELLRSRGVCKDYLSLGEEARVSALTGVIGDRSAVDETGLSAEARETLSLFRVLRRVAQLYGEEALGGYIISLTHELSDVLAVLWLAAREQVPIRIIPLFETIDDLRHAPSVFRAMLAHPAYAAHISGRGNTQTVMIGYSDSTKDGGYLAANWSLYRAQEQIHEVAEELGIRTLFFHGRGGSLGRGGGPAARSILSLPPSTIGAGLRMTEQGEVLAERYDDPQVAYRHLEQVAWATLMATARPLPAPSQTWKDTMELLCEKALFAYRELVEAPGFLAYFGQATPIEEIESLPIASRPARRHGERRLQDLRAIPWVFAWTQSRHLLPAWYGIGRAFDEVASSIPGGWDQLTQMYEGWAFFRATIDNAILALAKTDIDVTYHYAQLVENAESRERIWGMIAREFELARSGALKMCGQTELLADVPWLQRSIQVRNPNTDPLNFIQIEWLKRLRAVEQSAASEEIEELHDLLRLTIQGLAAGMRTTG